MGQVRAFQQKMRAYNSIKVLFVSVFLLVRLPLRLFSLRSLQCNFGGYIGVHVRVTRDGAGVGPCWFSNRKISAKFMFSEVLNEKYGGTAVLCFVELLAV